MAEKDTEFLNTHEPFRRVHLIGGEYATIDTNSIVGYCHNKDHKGFLTITIMNKQDCINKQCHYFEKFSDYPFWQRLYRREHQMKLKKEKEKRQKENQKRQILNKEKKNELYISYASKIVNELNIDNFKIIGIHPNENGYTIFYISDQPINDWYDFREIAFSMNKTFKKKFTLIHAKDTNGNYATNLTKK